MPQDWTLKTYLRFYGKRLYASLEPYCARTRYLLYSVLFSLPFLAAYLWGILVDGFDPNGGQSVLALIVNLLASRLGSILTKLIVGAAIAGALYWCFQRLRSEPLKIVPWTLPAMLVEAAVYALLLQTVGFMARGGGIPKVFTFVPHPDIIRLRRELYEYDSTWEIIHGAIGAGFMEELVFRVLLIRLLYFASMGNDMPFGYDREARNNAVLLSSVIFAAVHLNQFIGSSYVELLWGMVGHVFAGVVLAMIYLHRGYGVAAATHMFGNLYLESGVVS